MVRRNPGLYLKDILSSINAIDEYTRNMSEADFYQNGQVQNAVIRKKVRNYWGSSKKSGGGISPALSRTPLEKHGRNERCIDSSILWSRFTSGMAHY